MITDHFFTMTKKVLFKYCVCNSPWHCFLKLRKSITSSNRNKWNAVVGLEVHAQINTQSKLFSGASTTFGEPVNTNVSLFDAAIPGTLPVLNKKCVELGVLTAIALSCKINPCSHFDRKHYFYADLPAGYQITQQRSPLAKDGVLSFQVFAPGIHKTPYKKVSRIKQIQLEQDSGKSLHDEVSQRSLIDLNRAGLPLIELVFEPDLTDGEEAAALVKELILILTRINTCSCKMEEGALRVDANVSVNQKGTHLGIRTEIKNIGSIRGVAKAVTHEIERQIKILESGLEVTNETRTWDSTSGTTLPMRDKETKEDYRFMPEPNLPPLRLNMDASTESDLVSVENLKKQIPELPEETRIKLRTVYKVADNLIPTIVNEDALLRCFMQIVGEKSSRNSTLVAKILTNDIMTFVNQGIVQLDSRSFNVSHIGELIDLLQEGTINFSVAQKLLKQIVTGVIQSPTTVVQEKNLFQITDREKLKELCLEAIAKNPQMVAKYRSGKLKVLHVLAGYIGKTSNNKANLRIASEILKELLIKN